jgi:hypothetical protein
MNDNYRFGGGGTETSLTLAALVLVLVAALLILLLPRKRLLVPFLLAVFLIPLGQYIVLAGAHIYVQRILILVGLGRLAVSKSQSDTLMFAGGVNNIDRVFVLWAFVHAFAFVLLYGQIAAFVNQGGFLLDAVGGYCFLRFAIRDEDDIRRAGKVFALIAVVVAVGMVVEQRFMINVFSIVGGAAQPAMREGRLRSQGPFAHAILAGVFGATAIPLFVRLASVNKDKWLGIAGIAGATLIVVTSASSTALGAYVACIIGLCFWPLRRNMKLVRWATVTTICALALVMKAPVWFLLARVGVVGGSSGFHRAMLVDTCIRRFSDWWLLGANNNQNWGWDMWDTQNEFVAEALRGGLAAVTLFTMIVVRTLGRIGIARKSVDRDFRQSWSMWLLGVMIATHVVAFFGSDYFDQTKFCWFASLAIVSAATVPLLKEPRHEDQPESSAGEFRDQRFPSDLRTPVDWHPGAAAWTR